MTRKYALRIYSSIAFGISQLPIPPRIREAILQGILVDELDFAAQSLLRGSHPKAIKLWMDITSTSYQVMSTVPDFIAPNTQHANHPKKKRVFSKRLAQTCLEHSCFANPQPCSSSVLFLPVSTTDLVSSTPIMESTPARRTNARMPPPLLLFNSTPFMPGPT